MRNPQEWYRERFAELSAPLSDAEKKRIREDYREITGKRWEESFSNNCPNCYRDAIIIILSTMTRNNNKEAGGYVLKAGVVFRYKGKIITHHNITEAAAEWYIKQDIKNRDKFIELARDYDEYATDKD